jgi:hypothetical protein
MKTNQTKEITVWYEILFLFQKVIDLLMLALEVIALSKEEEMLRDGLLIIKAFRIKFCIFILESKKIMINEMDDERFNLIHRREF